MPDTIVLLVDQTRAIEQCVRSVVELTPECQFDRVEDGVSALERIQTGHVGMVVYHVPTGASPDDLDQLLDGIESLQARTPVLAITAEDDPYLRLNILKRGTVGCLCEPVSTSRLTLMIAVLTVRARHPVTGETHRTSYRPTLPESSVEGFLFLSPGMKQIINQVKAVAKTDATVLLTGETGTGKTHLARTIHTLSPRKDKPFLSVHCGTLSPNLFESELFGHTRGAFTHAHTDRPGKLADVQDGTLFLDDIDCVPSEAQSTLLRVVEERLFEPVGSNRTQSFDARLIVASNRPLKDDVDAGRFRPDLYYRLSVVNFHLPPLRERREVIRPMTRWFFAQVHSRDSHECVNSPETCPHYDDLQEHMSEAAVRALERYNWPGNVRELRNVIEGAMALCPDQLIDVGNLPEEIRNGREPREPTMSEPVSASGSTLERARHEAEAAQIREALRKHTATEPTPREHLVSAVSRSTRNCASTGSSDTR